MAVTSEQILGFLNANPGISDAEIVAAMEAYGVSPAQMAQAVGVTEGEVAARVAATIPEGQAKLLGDTWVQPQYQVTGSGEDRQVGGIENVQVYKNTGGGGINDEVAVGTKIQEYNPDGTFSRTTQTQKTDNSMLPFILGAAGLFGGIGGGFESLFGGGAAAGTAGTVGTTGLTMGELAQLDLALGGAGGTAGATSLANALMTGAAVPTITSLTGGSGAGLLTNLSNTVTSALGGGAASTLGGGGAATTLGGAATGGAATTLGGGAATTLGGGAASTVGGSTLANSLLSGAGSAVAGSLLGGTGQTGTNVLGSLLSNGLTTGAGLLQQQTSREAAQRAQAMIDAETAAAKAAAQFRPVGVTTRFGTSQFEVDPVTGQLKSAEYTLSPEAKYAQDKLVAQANLGLQQIEQAQGQFAPLQTGAQSLFALGNQYLAQTPEQVAQNYINQQMALLQPGRELELANLQNKLQQQGRAGLSVAQGGALGATTPELQALYNARAQQEAILAAQAQQAGQQQVAFGAGLLGQGAGAMGQYYAGQQAAYAPYTTALGQVQALEAAGQQPLTMGAALGQQAAQAGANVGRLGLTGAGQSVALATGPAATNNPYSSLMASLGSSPAFGQGVAGLLTGGLSGLQSAFSQTGLGSSGFGTGLAYGNQDLGLFL